MKTTEPKTARILILIIAALVAASAVLTGCGETEANTKTAGPDVISIDGMSVFEELDRAPVPFAHDKHTEALKKEEKDCSHCHPNKADGKLSLKFMRTENTTYDEVMNIYHDNCITCHKEMEEKLQKELPITCGECHQREPELVSNAIPISMDKSLHYRHITAVNDSCSLCHHEYDEAGDSLYYVKNKERSCRDCHLESTVDNRISFRLAAHEQCLSCHREREMGFVMCKGCHDRTMRDEIEVVENPARLNIGQAEFMLIAGPEVERAQTKLGSVPFSHIMHEQAHNNCRVCHHVQMSPCTECHTLDAGEKSGGVRLQRAMHDMNSEHSCVGCHEKQKENPECASCHFMIEKGTLSEHACEICHSGPKPSELAEVESRYTSIDDFTPKPADMKLTFSTAEIPDTVKIGILSDEYQPAVFPHRQIVNNLLEHINDNKIAQHFHGHENVVCQGCHHNSPAGVEPPLCENCHGEPFDESKLFVPGLFGAYHRQCIGCHEKMGIGKATECEKCHKKRDS